MDVELKPYKPELTQAKAAKAAGPVAIAAAVVALLRVAFGDYLFWGPDKDAVAAGVAATAVAGIWKYWSDRRKHKQIEAEALAAVEAQTKAETQTAFLKEMHETAAANRKAKDEKDTSIGSP